MAYKPTNTEHPFESLQDIFKFVDMDNVDMFIEDFRMMLKVGIQMINLSKIIDPENPIKISTFTWKDDGEWGVKDVIIQEKTRNE